MRAFTVSQTIDAPREQLFDYLCDVSNYGEFSDHYFTDLRLERLDSYGRGASLSFRISYPLGRQWGDFALAQLERPHKIVAKGRIGRIGRVPLQATYELTTVGHGMTRVDYTLVTEPHNPFDRLREAPGLRSWLKFQSRRALRRLARSIESGAVTGQPVRAAAG